MKNIPTLRSLLAGLFSLAIVQTGRGQSNPLGSQLSGLSSAFRSCIALLAVVFGLLGNGTAWAVTDSFTTAGSTTWTCPTGVTTATVECWGGGGSGGAGINGGGTTASSNAGGGGGGAYVIKAVSVTPGTVYTVVVGAGGAAGTSSNPGGDSSFATSLAVAKGGSAGGSVNGQSSGGAGGAGGLASASTGDTKYSGGNGATATSGSGPGGGGGSSAGTGANGNNGSGGTAGTAPTGGAAGGAGATSSNSGAAASIPGGGGGGAKTSSSTQRNGGAGGRGKVNITYTAAAGPSITGTATATAFTTTYGTPSTAQTFTIGGSNLTADITATAPTGFEVSNDGTTYGGTATFTQTSGSASGSLRIRLKADAAVSGSPYNSKLIALTSTGATTVNITTAASGNTVTAKALTITGLTGTEKVYTGTTAATFTGTAAYSGLANSESFSVTGTPVASFSTAAVGTSKSITITGYTAPSTNYSITQPSLSANITAAPLTITANNITKPQGTTLSSPITGSTAFSSSGLVNSETIGSVTITYGTGAASDAVADLYTGSVVASVPTGGTFTAGNYSINYVNGSITVSANPAISTTGTLSAVSTTYGTASASPSSFSVSGGFLTGDLTVTAPSPFVISTSSGGTYTSSLVLTQSAGAVASTTIYVRLPATATVSGSPYSGNVSISGGGATTQNVATSSSTVAAKALTLSGLAGVNRPYDRTTTATLSGTPAYVGLANGESFSVSGTASASFATKTVGTAKPITVTGYEAPSSNYSITQPTGLTANITSLALTVAGASVTSKTYNGTAAATISGASLVGVIALDAVTVSGGGTFADVNAANGISVTTALTLGGADAANYTLTQPTGLTGNITQATQTITFAALAAKLISNAPFALTGTASSALTVAYSSSDTSVATVSGSTVTIVGAGTTTITASQAGNGNYSAATSVPQTLTVTRPPLAVWNPTWSGTAASPLDANTKDTNLTSAQVSRVGLASAGNPSRHSSTAWNTTANYLTAVLTPASGYTMNLNGAILAGAWGSSGTGPGSYEVRSSVDNYASSLGTFTSTSGGTTNNNITLPESGYNGLSSITFRFIGSSTPLSSGTVTASGGTGGFSTLTVNGYLVAAPSITGATTASAFTTIYGTPSTAQTFSVSGANLMANLVATAPTGFEVASDGATYGGTATFTQSGGSASGTLSLRLKATAAVAFYNSKNIVLSTTGATSVNIVTAEDGNKVSAKALSITASARTKTYGDTLPLGTSSFSSVGLANSDTIGAVTLASSGSTASAAVDSYPVTPSAATGGTFTAGNYIITYNDGTLTVEPKALTITAFAVTKAFGETLASPVTGSTAFTSDGLVGSETIGSVTISYGTGAASDDATGAYADQVTPSAAVGGTFDIANYLPTYVSATLSVTANPTITAAGALAAVDTTYGTPSTAPSSFSVSGIFLTGDLTITPPAGFEVSSSIGSGYSTTLTLPASGTLGATSVYVRLAATTAFGTYSGNITISGGGATSQTVATASSSVAKKALTITGLTGANKPYDRSSAATTTGTPSYAGLENSDSFEVTGTPTASFTNATAGNSKTITVSGYTAPSDDYSVSQPSGLTGDITPLALTVTGATVTPRAYNGTDLATITGSTLEGVISPDVVTIATSTGTFSDVNAGTDIAVTAALTLGGADAGNYSLTQPSNLLGVISKVNQFISFLALPDKLTTDAPFALTATVTPSGLPVTFVADPDSSSVVTITGNDVTIVGAGTATITASQAGNINYNAATNVVRTLTVIVPPLANWTSPWSGTAASPLAAKTQKTNLESASLARVGLTGGSSSSRHSSSGWNSTANYLTATLTAASGYFVNLNGTTVTGTWSSSSSGPTSYDVRSSVDDYATSIGTFNSGSASSITLPATNFNNLSTITFRFIGSGASASAGTGGPSSLIFNGDVVIARTITGADTTTAFTTTYGTPSTEQSFAISGAGLSEDLTATAPTGFEVSSDGTSYGSTASFTQSSGTASGSLRIRLAATALVSGNYNSKDIVLSSSGATSVNITTASSGNVVSKATPTIVTAPTASGITFGETLADSDLTDGEASTGGTFAFTTPSTAPNAGTASRGVTFTPTDGDNYNNATTTVSVTTSKATPTITTAPTASGITSGETLASSSLTGGFASTDGTFAFTTPGTIPAVGTANQGVTFTPTDTGNYNNATTTVSVTVSSGSDPLFTTVGNSPTITFAAGVANIAFTGIPGRTYGIERSATLTDWTQIDTVTADSVSGAAVYQDQLPLQPAAFYRIVYPPAGN